MCKILTHTHAVTLMLKNLESPNYLDNVLFVYASMSVSVCICLSACVSLCLPGCVSVCMFDHVCVFVHTCVLVCVHTQLFLQRS